LSVKLFIESFIDSVSETIVASARMSLHMFVLVVISAVLK